MSTATETKPKTPRNLTNKLKKFAELYVEQGTDEYLNGTKAMMASGHTQNPRSAAVLASNALKNDNVLSYIEQLNRDAGNSIEDRSILLSDIVKGRRQTSNVSEQYNAEGKLMHRTVVTKPVTNDQVLKAIDLTNKVEGIYNKANVAEHVAKREYDERMSDLRAELADVIVARRKKLTKSIVE